MFDTPSGRFRAVAVAEAVSWAGLLIGMFFKYAMGNAIGVHIFGSVHGVVFIAYVVLSLLARRALRWDNRTTVWALVASIPPFGSVVFERWATRTGRLAERAVAISA
ncbi:DUF3817 domain-containing protein [Kutzneria kofuensis]|uniref:Integral membrane protein n=1 Tax=Kutzneria kofuensis TaxID=103725 RepID=A0A7W9NJ30_9PSEU|nr:DUF3817 domain-containing protein [Kutzneria kofuensis]MBB5893916.1 integral membrane protein [Kutzneria kofuensis]